MASGPYSAMPEPLGQSRTEGTIEVPLKGLPVLGVVNDTRDQWLRIVRHATFGHLDHQALSLTTPRA